jgi:hypothetical protein
MMFYCKHRVLSTLLAIWVLSNDSCASDPLNDTVLPISPFPVPPNGSQQGAGRWLSPEYKWFFEFPLPIPPTKEKSL